VHVFQCQHRMCVLIPTRGFSKLRAPLQVAVHLVLPVLPAGLRTLELLTESCCGRVLEAAARFTELHINGVVDNGAIISWPPLSPAASAVLRQLRTLRLDFRRLSGHMVFPLHENAVTALAHASTLRSLELDLCWSEHIPALCCAFPSLRQLRWAWAPQRRGIITLWPHEVYSCWAVHGATEQCLAARGPSGCATDAHVSRQS